MSEPELKPTIDVDKPVKVTIEITGHCLDDTLYAIDMVRESISRDRTSGQVGDDPSEMYRFKVEQLDLSHG